MCQRFSFRVTQLVCSQVKQNIFTLQHHYFPVMLFYFPLLLQYYFQNYFPIGLLLIIYCFLLLLPSYFPLLLLIHYIPILLSYNTSHNYFHILFSSITTFFYTTYDILVSSTTYILIQNFPMLLLLHYSICYSPVLLPYTTSDEG